MKAKLSLLLMSAALLAGSFMLLRQYTLSSAQEGLAIPLPTPGPPPVLPTRVQPLVDTVTTAEAAFQRAIEYDRAIETYRSSPLALEINAASVGGVPSNVIVEAFTTRQEASDIYPDLGVFPQPEDADEPVWIVFIDGKADVVNLGAPWLREKVRNTLYVISRRDGGILSIAYNIDSKSSKP